MAADKQEGIGGITMRQKLIGAGIVIVVIIVIWQVVGLMGSGDTSSTPEMKMTPPAAANKPAGQMTNSAPNMQAQPGGAAPNAAMQPPQQPQQIQPQKDQTANNNVLLLREQQDEQKKYLSTVNELEMLKLQKDIAETNQAIASAKLATVTAEKNINDLLTRPVTPPSPPVPAGDYANKLVGVVQAGSQVVGAPSSAPPTGASYVVISVSMQSGKWTAVLGLGGKLYNVSVGDVLPADGSIVASINKSGVTLRNDGTKRKISLVPVI